MVPMASEWFPMKDVFIHCAQVSVILRMAGKPKQCWNDLGAEILRMRIVAWN
jgi:hypothetical protein